MARESKASYKPDALPPVGSAGMIQRDCEAAAACERLVEGAGERLSGVIV